jgi:hypothetical protein
MLGGTLIAMDVLVCVQHPIRLEYTQYATISENDCIGSIVRYLDGCRVDKRSIHTAFGNGNY